MTSSPSTNHCLDLCPCACRCRVSGASASCSPAGVVFLHCASPWHHYLSVTPHAHARHYYRCSARCSHPEAPFVDHHASSPRSQWRPNIFIVALLYFVVCRASLNSSLRAHCRKLCMNRFAKLRTACLGDVGRPLENGASLQESQSVTQRPTGRTSQAGALPAVATSRRSAGA